MTNELLAEVSLLRNKVKKYEEAWEKAREEIKYYVDNIKYTDTYRDGFYVSLKIIDKYLKEIENEHKDRTMV